MREADTQRQKSSRASGIMAWVAVLVVFPVAALAAYALVPNTAELIDRVLHHPLAPRRSLAIMLSVQIALIALSTLTLISYFHDRVGKRPRYLKLKTGTLSGLTLAVGLFAYLWIAVMIAAFPD